MQCKGQSWDLSGSCSSFDAFKSSLRIEPSSFLRDLSETGQKPRMAAATGEETLYRIHFALLHSKQRTKPVREIYQKGVARDVKTTIYICYGVKKRRRLSDVSIFDGRSFKSNSQSEPGHGSRYRRHSTYPVLQLTPCSPPPSEFCSGQDLLGQADEVEERTVSNDSATCLQGCVAALEEYH
jgi:hypothetical protein